ncbi:hypothetical protein ACIQ9R_03230 [Streptomyces sp. NPDC094447]|uniref:hypothetical protein n=1 Tax=Streptomyces sp. NPDC094447 TaxID=3366062 RepID=UPI0038100DA4
MERRRGTALASALPGAMRGVWTAVAAAVCVLLPAGGHLLVQGHLPRWAVLCVLLLCGAGAAALVGPRRRVSDARLLAALAGAQAVYQAAYAVPGACAAVGVPDGLPAALGHATAAGVPPEAFAMGHAVTLVLTVRRLGVVERFRWQTPPALHALVAVVRLVRPCCGVPAARPVPARRGAEDEAPPLTQLAVRTQAGRAPPQARPGPTGRASRRVPAASRRLSPYALAA